MSGTVLARLAAAAFLMIVVLVAIIAPGRQGEEVRASRPAESADEGPFSAELQRCQALGEAALQDQSCLTVWAEKRRRFLRPGSTSERSE